MTSTPAIGWNFDHSYKQLPKTFYSNLSPTPVEAPALVIFNEDLSKDLGLDFSNLSDEEKAKLFSGNELPSDSEPLCQAYAGHQFGNFTYLGDGRAHLLGEHITPEEKRFDIQFKGSGQTPYSRRGDGRAALGPMLREYIISEAMYGLNIPTTRSLCVTFTGEPVFRQRIEPGAILTRVAQSHLRVGTFQYIAAESKKDALKALADYAIDRHYPDLKGSDTPYADFLSAVQDRQIDLICNWMRVGFIHGVMNTDNMTICGETIDYGPCAFMDDYHPNTVFSSIDTVGRYSFANQSHIAQWNLARLAETLLPLLDTDQKKAISIAEKIVFSFSDKFKAKWLTMMGQKLGIESATDQDETLIMDYLKYLSDHGLDYTNSFRELAQKLTDTNKLESPWEQAWLERLSQNKRTFDETISAMNSVNPAMIPRNHRVEAALKAAEQDADFSVLHNLLAALKSPYIDVGNFEEYKAPPKDEERVKQTFCGT
jgi:uncharacterized protein YdiU (UPF0061 family)